MPEWSDVLILEELNRIMRTEVPPVGMPKYVHLSHSILHLIENGDLKPGQKLPSESEFAKELPISLGTVQKALSSLAQRGVINRKLGLGTFVEGAYSVLKEPSVYQFIGDDGKTALPVFTKVTSIERVDEPGPWADFLGEDDFYVCVARTIDIDHEFLVAAQFYLRGPEFAPLLTLKKAKLDGVHLGSYLRQQFGASTQRVIERMICQQMPPSVCQEIGVEPKSYGLVRYVRAYRERNRPLSFQIIYVPPASRCLEIPTTR